MSSFCFADIIFTSGGTEVRKAFQYHAYVCRYTNSVGPIVLSAEDKDVQASSY